MADAAPTVDPKWLQEQITAGNANLRLFDCSLWLSGLLEEEYRREHIVGAQFLSVFEGAMATRLQPVAVPDMLAFQAYARSLGVSQDSHVVLYDNVDMTGFTAPRFWWTFRLFGHERVSVLNGGLKRWIREGFPVTGDATPKLPEGNFTAKLCPELLATYEEMQPGKLPPAMQILDARYTDIWSGQEREPSALLQAFAPAIRLPLESIRLATGHIPGSYNLPYPHLFCEDAMDTLKDPSSIKQLFQKAGVDLERPLVSTCYVGLTACLLALAAAMCGKMDVRMYTGSWVEYGQKATEDMVEVSTEAASGATPK